jgi:hypothetical protein
MPPQASVPYFAMLEGWVLEGLLEDPYREFMVREEEGLSKENVQEDFNAAYWDARWAMMMMMMVMMMTAMMTDCGDRGGDARIVRCRPTD